MRRLILAALAASALAGCPAAHDGYPSKSCTTNSDCFEGEICDSASNQCVNSSAPGGDDGGGS